MADETQTAAVQDNGPDGAADTPAGSEEVAALKADAAEAKDRLVRTLAEMENLRRRTEREIADTKQYAVANFAREVLTVADNLKRAIAAVPPEARSADPALSNLLDGVEATERGLEQTLQKFGVRPIEAKGQKFNPDVHQAMFEVESTEFAPGTVAQVVQTGYAIGERTLRPALVGVAKAKPAAANQNAPVGAG